MLRVAGSRPDLVVSTTVLVADLVDFPAMNSAFADFFPSGPPTRMTMQVPLPRGLRISIGAPPSRPVEVCRKGSYEPARSPPTAARPASSRATGTRNGEQET